MLRLWFSMEARELFLSQMKIVSYHRHVRPIAKKVSNGGAVSFSSACTIKRPGNLFGGRVLELGKYSAKITFA
jgi:hypothetical protein